MKFTQTPVVGAFIVELEPADDTRGFFARTWCAEEFAAHGLNPNIEQCSLSFNQTRGTLRGLHLQIAPHEETKLVRCIRNAVFDVIVDLRSQSTSYLQWYAVELSADNRRSIYIPEGVAHGFQSLSDNCEVFYQISTAYRPNCSRGIRWDDPKLKIRSPVSDPIVSARDMALPFLDNAALNP
jgi:dTDP-4-dehydrorhamnose 3,5-epimerase